MNETDSVYFEAMLSAIGVVKAKPSVLVVERLMPPEPWKPKDENEDCPF